jgi:hypothetical protein
MLLFLQDYCNNPKNDGSTEFFEKIKKLKFYLKR